VKANDRPLIGITMSVDDGARISAGHEYLYVKRAYARAVVQAGGNPLFLSPDIDPKTVARICDGLVISGGDDIPPDCYGEDHRLPLSPESVERIDSERRLLDHFSAASIPVLGVCYGMQLLNVHFGGTLLQDIPGERSSPAEVVGVDHGGGGRRTEHTIQIKEGSFLHSVFGGSTTVCSTHHQGIKALAPGFSAVATAPDGVIEAIEKGNLLGVQWHPESDGTGPGIYRHLVERAESR
jgi:putative glutamine amidotransferase